MSERFTATAGALRAGDVVVQELYRDGVYARDGDRFSVLSVKVGSAKVVIAGFIESTGSDRRMTFDADATMTVERPA